MKLFDATVIRHTIRDAAVQPLFLFALIVEIIVILLVAFAFDLQSEDGRIVGIVFLGTPVQEAVPVFLHYLLSTVLGLTTGILMFLLIMTASSFTSELLRSPLLAIFLTKPVSRAGLLVSRFAGLLILVAGNLILFAFLISALLSYKTGEPSAGPLVACALSFALEFLVILALSTFATMIVDHPFGIAVIVIAFYYLVGPLIADAEGKGVELARLVSFVVPPIGALSRITREIILGGTGLSSIPLIILPQSLLILTAAVFLFERKDCS